MAAISLVTLLLCASLAVDVGYICALTTEAQNNADSAALAGASALKDNDTDFRARALDVLSRNQDAQGFQSLDDQIIELGRWDKVAQAFSVMADSEIASANAVRVRSVRAGVPLFFAGIAGHEATTVQREAVAMSTPSCNGVWGIDSATVPGSVIIDSWDSTTGAYAPTSANENGDVCSNGEVTVSGSAEIHGDVLSATGDVTINGGAATITGFTESAVDPVSAPPVDLSEPFANNDNGTIPLTDAGTDPLDGTSVSTPGYVDLILNSGENLTLLPGVYIFDDIELKSNSSITLTGPTTIYIDDDLEMASSAVFNTSQDPADLTIIADGDTDTSRIKLSGNAAFYGSIYAPETDIEFSGSADFYGAVIGQTLDFKGGFSFHVDESLDLINSLKGPVVLVQ